MWRSSRPRRKLVNTHNGNQGRGEIRVDASLSCNATSIGLYKSSRRWKKGKQGGKFADRTRRGETGCVATVRLHDGTRHVPCTGIHPMVGMIPLLSIAALKRRKWEREKFEIRGNYIILSLIVAIHLSLGFFIQFLFFNVSPQIFIG